MGTTDGQAYNFSRVEPHHRIQKSNHREGIDSKQSVTVRSGIRNAGISKSKQTDKQQQQQQLYVALDEERRIR
ncbi:hypothetical protein PG987_016586 [Apiospora arundinis]